MSPVFVEFETALYQLEAVQHVSAVFPDNKPDEPAAFAFYVVMTAGPVRIFYTTLEEATAKQLELKNILRRYKLKELGDIAAMASEIKPYVHEVANEQPAKAAVLQAVPMVETNDYTEAAPIPAVLPADTTTI